MIQINPYFYVSCAFIVPSHRSDWFNDMSMFYSKFSIAIAWKNLKSSIALPKLNSMILVGYQPIVTKNKLDKPSHSNINEQQPTCQHRRTTVFESKPKTKQKSPHDRVLFAAVLRYHSTVTATKLLLHQSHHTHTHTSRINLLPLTNLMNVFC